MNGVDAVNNLRLMAGRHDVNGVANIVLYEPRFATWAGSSVVGAHHCYDGGLAEHTYEVAKLCEINSAALPGHPINQTEMFLAALFHDVGKMWDYERVDGVWEPTTHKRLVHHVSRSGIEWVKAAEKFNIPQIVQDRVLHSILAHHGRREWGSPVAPKSRMAWLLHLCDQVSARMNDCDTNDLVLRKDK